MGDQVRMSPEDLAATSGLARVGKLLAPMLLQMRFKTYKVGILIRAARAVEHHPVVYCQFWALCKLLRRRLLTHDQVFVSWVKQRPSRFMARGWDAHCGTL